MNSTLAIGWLTLFMSLLIAGCAAYFSISGLSVLFAAALIPVIIMATTLEIGKLGATFFLHRYWDELPWRIKYPLAVMVTILMIITSMGIFGFLSKGHIEQEAPTVELSIDINDANQEIAQHQDTIKGLQSQLDQLNASLGKLIEYAKVSGKGGYLARQKELQPQLDELQRAIEVQKTKIKEIRDIRSVAKRSMGAIEAKLGPIKYVAELFGYDLQKDPDGRGKAVRIVIVMFMLAFDPFAIFLIMAADWIFIKYRAERLVVVVKERDEELDELRKSAAEALDLQLENEDLKFVIDHHLKEDTRLDNEIQEEFRKGADVYQELVNTKDNEIRVLTEMLETTETVEHVVFREIEVPVEIPIHVENAEHIRDLEHALITLEIQLEEKTMELNEFLATLEQLDENLSAKPTEIEKVVEVENTERVDALENDKRDLNKSVTEAEDKIAGLDELNKSKDQDLIRAAEEINDRNIEINNLQSQIAELITQLSTAENDIEARDKAVEKLNTKYQLVERIPGMSLSPDNTPDAATPTSFGTDFPENPVKDQMFLRVDSMPSKLYVYEGTRWIESTKTNETKYDEKYLQHLVNELGDGKVELDELSEKEQAEIHNLLSKEDVLGK